jgi:hypothetical protein
VVSAAGSAGSVAGVVDLAEGDVAPWVSANPSYACRRPTLHFACSVKFLFTKQHKLQLFRSIQLQWKK